MIINRESWLLAVGQAGGGKTFWIKKHLEMFPKLMAYIYDFNCNDYQEFEQTQNLWNVQYGNEKEIEDFLKIPYGKGNCFVILEEADNYLLYPSDMVQRFVNTARNRGIGCIVSAKRAKAVKPVYRNRFTHLIIFRGSLPEDVKYMEEWAGTGKGSLEFVRGIGCTCGTFENPNPPCTCGKKGQYIIVDVAQHRISEVKKL